MAQNAPIDPLPKVWDPDSRVGDMLSGRRGLVVGIANEYSIAFGCAAKLRAFGAELAVTYLNEKAKPYVQPLAEEIGASLLMPLDVQQPGQLEAVFERIRQEWGRLDFLIHSIAFAPREDCADCASVHQPYGFARCSGNLSVNICKQLCRRGQVLQEATEKSVYFSFRRRHERCDHATALDDHDNRSFLSALVVHAAVCASAATWRSTDRSQVVLLGR